MLKSTQTIHSQELRNSDIRSIFCHSYPLFMLQFESTSIYARPCNLSMHIHKSLSSDKFCPVNHTNLTSIKLWKFCLFVQFETYIHYILLRIQLLCWSIGGIKSCKFWQLFPLYFSQKTGMRYTIQL